VVVIPLLLLRAPADALGPTGEPRLGRYLGSLGRVDLASLAPEGMVASLRHAARSKRWQRVLLVLPDHLLFLEILDGGTLAAGSTWIAERTSGEVLFDRDAAGVTGLNVHVGERPGAGARASFTAPGVALGLERRADRYRLTADLGGSLQLDVMLDTREAPEPFSMVAGLPDGGLRAAQVTGPMSVEGTLKVRGRPVPIDGGLAVLEYGAGLFPREVGWRKVTAVGRLADGQPVALHLVDGLPGATNEDGADDVLLVGSGPVALPPVVVEIDPGTAIAPSRILSPDGLVDLSFKPAAAHRESRGLFLVSLETSQLAGGLSGTLPGPGGRPLKLSGLPCVLEDREARW
jgi:Protein of unknown function (DUF2804)